MHRAFVLCLACLLAACSAGVSSPPTTPTPPGDPNRIEIQPGSAVAFSQTPTTFVITGGNGSYIVSSSNQGVVPISGLVQGNLLTIVPNFVTTETPVTLTVRDTGTATLASATLTVRPRTVSSTLVVTPSVDDCAPAICAGHDATIEATLAENGAALAGRSVTFDVESGDLRFITGGTAGAETLATTVNVTTDVNGKARVRVRALSTAPSQTAIVRVTDAVGGSFVRTGVLIKAGSATAPTTVPQTITVRGTSGGTCPTTSASVDVYVFGGVPPYTVSNTQPNSVEIQGFVNFNQSGGFFRVRTLPGCFVSQIVVSDSIGQRTIVEIQSLEGTTSTSTGNLVVAPQQVTLESCTSVANVTVAGGQGVAAYQDPVSSNADIVRATKAPNSNVITIQRVRPSPATTLTQTTVSISDGRSTAAVTVNLAPGSAAIGSGQQACPP